jgi:Putative peptidoglycan binding domain
MKLSRISAFCVIAVVLPAIHSAFGQVINAKPQTVAPRVATTRSAPAPKAFGVARTATAPRVAPMPATINPRVVNSSAPRAIAQPPISPQGIYFLSGRASNANLAMLDGQHAAPAQQTVALDPATRETELRTLAGMRERGFVKRAGNILDPSTRQTELRTIAAMRERRDLGTENQTLATINPQRHVINPDPEAGPQMVKHELPKEAQGKKKHDKKHGISFDEAFRRHWHEWHDSNWWHNNCDTIVVVATGYYFLDGSYWYPAYGYDPLQSYYDYDGPIYTYSNLLPDEVIANVQTALQDAGYYYGQITGSLSIDTRAAIANFQRDNGLDITGAIDEATVEALGLY